MMRTPKQRSLQVVMAVHTLIYRLSQGQWLNVDGHIILLSTLGRRSGQLRTAPLFCIRDGEAYVVIGSYGGNTHHPAWYLNLQARPRALVVDRGQTWLASAEDVTGNDYERLWNLLVLANPTYQQYRARTTRQLPIIRLHPQ
ncbi:MAG: nitroreductase/quinone reductase family protein [Oscillochloridaceae bacterium umkhey_bin13]